MQESIAREMPEPSINPVHKEVLDKIRLAFTNSGGHVWDQTGYDPLHTGIKTDDNYQLDFNFGTPHDLVTPDGYYRGILGGVSWHNDEKRLMTELSKFFEIEEVKPKRDEKEVEKRDRVELLTELSGPVIKLTPKDSLAIK